MRKRKSTDIEKLRKRLLPPVKRRSMSPIKLDRLSLGSLTPRIGLDAPLISLVDKEIKTRTQSYSRFADLVSPTSLRVLENGHEEL